MNDDLVKLRQQSGIPFWYIGFFTTMMPAVTLICILLLANTVHFEVAGLTHCNNKQYLATISSAVGQCSPEKYLFRIGMGVHSGFKIIFTICIFVMLKYASLSKAEQHDFEFSKNRNNWNLFNRANLVFGLLEDMSLVMLVMVASVEHRNVHQFAFGSFLICSMTHSFFSIKTENGVAEFFTPIMRNWISVKKKIFFAQITLLILCVYLFWKHNKYCEPMTFALVEYALVFLNIYFHYATLMQFKLAKVYLHDPFPHANRVLLVRLVGFMLYLGKFFWRTKLGVACIAGHQCLSELGRIGNVLRKTCSNECRQGLRCLKDITRNVKSMSNEAILELSINNMQKQLFESKDLQYTDYHQQAPWKLLGPKIELMNKSISTKLTSTHPTLQSISNYYFNLKGKRLRALIVLLMGEVLSKSKQNTVNASIVNVISEKQFEIAQIVEMIHTASLIHDDVIDQAELRRNMPSINAMYGEKMAVLAGDFIFARISVALAELNCIEVTKTMSRVLVDLVDGEITQFNSEDALNFDVYMMKTYQKTASLIANGCRCVAIVASVEQELVEIATLYGKHVGIAFQLIDDVLDYIGSDQKLGKPTSNDIKLGLTTAPALFAKDEFPEMSDIIQRNFTHLGDVERARVLVLDSNGIEKTRKLASMHCQMALEAITDIENSPYKQALVDLTHVILNRDK